MKTTTTTTTKTKEEEEEEEEEETTNQWAKSKAIELLNEAKQRQNVSEKLQRFQEIEELLTKARSSRALMDFVLEDLLEHLLVERDLRIRKFLCELLEKVSELLGALAGSGGDRTNSRNLKEKNGKHLSAVLDALLVLVRDSQQPAAQKRAVAAAVVAFREALVNAAIEGADVEPVRDDCDDSTSISFVAVAWKKALNVADAIAETVLLDAVNDGVRMQCAKFCESACLLLAGVGWGASVVKPTHMLLKLDELGKLSDRKRETLSEGLKKAIKSGSKPCGPFTLTLVGALGTVCVKSERHAVESLQALIKASSNLYARFANNIAAAAAAAETTSISASTSITTISESAKASASKAFAQTFTEIAKKAPSFAISGELKDSLATACRELGATAMFEQAMRQRERERGKSALLKNASSIRQGAGLKREHDGDSLEPLTAGDTSGIKRARLRAPPPPPPLSVASQQQHQQYHHLVHQPYMQHPNQMIMQNVPAAAALVPQMLPLHMGHMMMPPPPPPQVLHPRTDPILLRQVLETMERLALTDLNMLKMFVTQLNTVALADAVMLFFQNQATTLSQAVCAMDFVPLNTAITHVPTAGGIQGIAAIDLGTGAILSAIARVEALSKKSNRKFALDCAKRIRAYGALRADGDAKANSLSAIRSALIARLACADAIPNESANTSKDFDDKDDNQPPMADESKVGVLKHRDGNRIASHVADAPMVAKSILFPVDDENAPLERDGVQSCARWLAALHAAELAQSLNIAHTADGGADMKKKKKKGSNENDDIVTSSDGFYYYSIGVRKDDAIRAVMRILASDPRARRHEISEKRLSGEKKLLSKILCEIPFDIPNKAWDALREMLGMSGIDEYDVSRDEAFSIESNKNDDSVVNLALHVLRDLCVDRPPSRSKALEILLECATNTDASSDERTRAKAIRLVANRLHQQHSAEADASTVAVQTTNDVEQYAITAATEKGRDIANLQLKSINEAIEARAIEKREAEAIEGMTTKEEEDGGGGVGAGKEEETDEGKKEPDGSSDLYEIAKKIAVVPSLLLCALTAKNPSLLPHVFVAYEALPLELRRGLHGPVAGLARRLGPSSPDIVRAISSSSIDSRPLVLYIVQALAKASAPAPLPKALVNACETLAAATKLSAAAENVSDAYMEVALVYGSIEKEHAKRLLSKIVDVASPSVFERAILSSQESNLATKASATDILVALHELDIRTTDDDDAGVSLKALVDACGVCFSAETALYFSAEAVASALSQLVDRTPLPKLFMRTAMLAETAHPSLKEFSVELLEKLAKRKVWKMDRGVWEGFCRSCKKAAPRSFPVLATLPSEKTREILEKFANLKAPLTAYANATKSKNLLEALCSV